MIELIDATIVAGTFRLQEISFCVDRGQYAVLMGQTGQGKSTILEAICGLRQLPVGRIRINEQDVTDWSVADRGIGYVPQDLALFPTMTVRQHLTFALKLRRWSTDNIQHRTEELASRLGIEPLLDRYPRGLSGGESQRVALGRALSFRPNVLLLDEPFSALDDVTRREMYALLKNVTQAESVTTLHVTHSQDEAEALATCRLWLKEGTITQSLSAATE